MYIFSLATHTRVVQMKYKTEIGESMEKPGKKLKKILLIVGITGAVYTSFKYLLPLVIPFLIAYVFALVLRPSVLWLSDHLHIKIRKKEFHAPLALIGGIEIVLLMVLVGMGIYAGGRRLCIEAGLLFDNLPSMIAGLDSWLTSNCFWMERFLHLPQGCLVRLLRDMILNMGKAMKDTAMPFLMVNSMTILKLIIQTTVITVILFVATILSLQEMEDIRNRRDCSLFSNEFAMLGNRLMMVGNAYLKTQGSIMILTTLICIAGLFLMRNPYCIMAGIGIGLLDALPIFGTGTVLIPWAIVNAVRGDWLRAGGLVLIYVVCYFLRQILEAKMMGNKVGLSSLETLISMYVGLCLFGIPGFIIGPVGLLIIEDMVALCEGRGP